jgi:hypothetical protein
MRKTLASGMFAAALLAAAVFPATGLAAGLGGRTFSIVAHFEYLDGFEYDYTVATGVEASEVSSYLAECGRGHAQGAGAVVRFHCYPVPE